MPPTAVLPSSKWKVPHNILNADPTWPDTIKKKEKNRYCLVIEKVGRRCLPMFICNTALFILIWYDGIFVKVFCAFLPFRWISMLCISPLSECQCQGHNIQLFFTFSLNSAHWVDSSSLCHLCSLKKLCEIHFFVMVDIHFEERGPFLIKLTATLVCILLVQWPYFQGFFWTGTEESQKHTSTQRQRHTQPLTVTVLQKTLCSAGHLSSHHLKSRCRLNGQVALTTHKRVCFCLPLHSLWQQACRAQCMGMAEHAEGSTTAELYSIGQAAISQKKTPKIQLFFFLLMLHSSLALLCCTLLLHLINHCFLFYCSYI